MGDILWGVFKGRPQLRLSCLSPSRDEHCWFKEEKQKDLGCMSTQLEREQVGDADDLGLREAALFPLTRPTRVTMIDPPNQTEQKKKRKKETV